MTIQRKPSVIGPTDPDVARSLQANLKQAAIIANGKPTVSNSELILPSTTVRATATSVTLNTSANNQPSDTVTVYPSSGNVYVSSIDQTIKQNIVNQTGVYSIIAGTNVTISSTGVGGTGNVTINAAGGGSGSTGDITFSGTTMSGPTGSADSYSIYIKPSADFPNTLQIYPTADNDIHMFERFGNAITLGSYGESQLSVWGPNSPNANITVQSNGSIWEFGEDGGTIFPTLNVQRGDNPSDTITGQTLLFGDAGQEAIISTPNGDAGNENSQRLVINPGAGYDYGEGGDIYLWAGLGGAGSGSGGDIKIRGGQGGANTTGGAGGAGGYILVEAGDSASTGGNPGYIGITGGQGANTYGGYVDITGGVGGNGDGGNVTIHGGFAATGHNGGAVSIYGGSSADGASSYGNVSISSGGQTWTFDNTGNLSVPGNIDMTSNWINNVGSPSLSTDVATKGYVDTYVTSGISYHQPVAVATTTTLAIATGGTTAYVEPNGAGNGIGAYISTTGTYLNIDTANVQTVGTRILVKNEANAAWNGVYTYATTTTIVRATDADQYGADSVQELSINDYFFTTGGSVNKGVAFVVSAPSGTIVFGTSNITFSEFSTSQVYTSGTGINISGTVISANASQTQITAVGTLGSLNVSGNANIGNIGTAQLLATANVTAPQLISNIATGTAPLVVTSTTVVANLNANSLQGNTPSTANTASTIALRDTNGNLSANFFVGNGSALTGITVAAGSSISNGNSNVSIATANGNVTIAAVGNTTMTITGTGANITGTANISGNVTVGNLIGPVANGNSNVNIATSNGNVTITAVGNTTMTISGTGANITGTANISGNLAAGNVSATTYTGTTSNITGQFISTLATGTAPLVVSSTTVVANLNANALQGNTPATANTANTIALRDSSGNLSANFFIGNGSQLTGISTSSSSISNGNSNVNIATSNGNVTITAVGNTTMTISGTGANITGTANISGNANVGNIGAATGVFSTAANTGLVQNGTSNITIASGANVSVFTAGNSTAQFVVTSTGANIPGTANIVGNVNVGNLIGPHANGNSNINIPAANGNINFSAIGNANILVITGTGANIAGTANISGNVNVGNLIGPHANGNSNVNIPAANGNVNISAVGNANIVVVTGTGANIAGTLNVTGNITGNTNGFAIGYLNIPQVAASNTTFALTDAGKHYYSTLVGNYTLTIPLNSSVAFSNGAAISIVVQSSGNVLVNAASGVTLYLAGNSTAGNRIVSNYGMATLMKVGTDTWFINGTGVA